MGPAGGAQGNKECLRTRLCSRDSGIRGRGGGGEDCCPPLWELGLCLPHLCTVGHVLQPASLIKCVPCLGRNKPQSKLAQRGHKHARTRQERGAESRGRLSERTSLVLSSLRKHEALTEHCNSETCHLSVSSASEDGLLTRVQHINACWRRFKVGDSARALVKRAFQNTAALCLF